MDWVFSPHLTAWVFPEMFLWSFLPQLKLRLLHCLLSMGFLASKVKKLVFLRVLGFQPEFKKIVRLDVIPHTLSAQSSNFLCKFSEAQFANSGMLIEYRHI